MSTDELGSDISESYANCVMVALSSAPFVVIVMIPILFELVEGTSTSTVAFFSPGDPDTHCILALFIQSGNVTFVSETYVTPKINVPPSS